ncbi:nucleotidyltransferase domain-containing protein, partial [Salmonella enterica]|nr:nucleotidyltransferase domain-containing protein [Salmonella enterica]
MQGINIGGGGARVSYRTLHLPQGVALNEFYDFANKLRGLLREKGIPDGKIYIHGSRANGMASSRESDIDIMVVISDAEFDALAAKRMELLSDKMKLKIARMVNNQQRLNGRALGQ